MKAGQGKSLNRECSFFFCVCCVFLRLKTPTPNCQEFELPAVMGWGNRCSDLSARVASRGGLGIFTSLVTAAGVGFDLPACSHILPSVVAEAV